MIFPVRNMSEYVNTTIMESSARQILTGTLGPLAVLEFYTL
jgi:hypothetical protein